MSFTSDVKETFFASRSSLQDLHLNMAKRDEGPLPQQHGVKSEVYNKLPKSEDSTLSFLAGTRCPCVASAPGSFSSGLMEPADSW